MSSSDTNIFAWKRADADRLKKAGGRKAVIAQREQAFWRLYHNDFEGADLAITEAIQAAQAESEVRWELFLRHWRVQLRMKEDLRRALPEAIDLLTLAEDPHVHDVPQRICAFHDIVYCHLAMDPFCYGEDTIENSEAVLAQTPIRFDCSDCARMNRATALAAMGRRAEALAALAQFQANKNGTDAGWLTLETSVYLLLDMWDGAVRTARQAVEATRKGRVADDSIQAHIHLARALIELGHIQDAENALTECRRMTKYAGGSYLLAQLLEMDGRLFVAVKRPVQGMSYLGRAAERYYALARYREAALVGLLAAEVARDHQHASGDLSSEADTSTETRFDPELALTIVAQALGAVRSPDPSLTARLKAFGKVPVPPAAHDAVYVEPSSGGVREGLEAELEAHLANGNPRGVATALYRQGAWLTQHQHARAAVDYLILNGIMERALRLTHSSREDALQMLTEAAKTLPQGSVDAAFAAMERGVPARFASIFGSMSPKRWQWLTRAVAAEWRGEAVVEPENHDQVVEQAFITWIDHTSSMTALVLRFRTQANPEGVARWTRSLRKIVQDSKGPSGNEPTPLTTFTQSLVALCEGESPQSALALAEAPFIETVSKIIELAGHPVWEHPGNASLDYFIEHDAQMAVRALRLEDEHAATRRENMAFRFELQALDFSAHESLADVARFLNALAEVTRSNGALPASASELPQEFQKILSAVSSAGGAREQGETVSE